MAPQKRSGDKLKERENQYPRPDDIPILLATSEYSDMAGRSYVGYLLENGHAVEHQPPSRRPTYITPDTPTWRDKIRSAWRYAKGELVTEPNRSRIFLESPSDLTKKSEVEPLGDKSRLPFRAFFGRRNHSQTTRTQLLAEDVPPIQHVPPSMRTSNVQRRPSFDSLYDASDIETGRQAQRQEKISRYVDENNPGSRAHVSNDETRRQVKTQEVESLSTEDNTGSTADVSEDGHLRGPSYKFVNPSSHRQAHWKNADSNLTGRRPVAVPRMSIEEFEEQLPGWRTETKRPIQTNDEKLREDLPHFAESQQGGPNTPSSRFPIAKVPHGLGIRNENSFPIAAPSGFPVAKSCDDQKQNVLPLPMPPGVTKKWCSEGKEFKSPGTRPFNAMKSSQTRFPVKPSQQLPSDYDAARGRSPQLRQVPQQYPTYSSPQMPKNPNVPMRCTKFTRPFEFPPKSPVTNVDVIKSLPGECLLPGDRAQLSTELAGEACVELQTTTRPYSRQTQSSGGIDSQGPVRKQSLPRPTVHHRPHQKSQTHLQPLLLRSSTAAGRGLGRGGNQYPPRDIQSQLRSRKQPGPPPFRVRENVLSSTDIQKQRGEGEGYGEGYGEVGNRSIHGIDGSSETRIGRIDQRPPQPHAGNPGLAMAVATGSAHVPEPAPASTSSSDSLHKADRRSLDIFQAHNVARRARQLPSLNVQPKPQLQSQVELPDHPRLQRLVSHPRQRHNNPPPAQRQRTPLQLPLPLVVRPKPDNYFLLPAPDRSRPPPSPAPLTVPVVTITFEERNSSVEHIESGKTAKMDNKLQVRSTDTNRIRTKAVEDARQMQNAVVEMCNKSGKSPPKYCLTELIGKGTFGRVYKSKDMSTGAIVSVKIIDIDESDTLNPRNADAYGEFLKEVNALKILSENNARNINHVIEALPVGPAMWMVTEFCAGGSIATLMKPTAPGGLQEKWIIPVVRGVAEAIRWVHEADIIHRDIKCANVLITEQGGVQLCDFGVAGIMEQKFDKRTTVIGTPHWMAPELFGSNVSYGKEIDIWAFGSMVYEVATGLPPNVGKVNTFSVLQARHAVSTPRLEGGNYSDGLRDLVAFCLEEAPSARPTIEQIQRHPYIHNTGLKYPTSSLAQLVRAFMVWEQHGGSRKSLFMPGGAQGLGDVESGATVDSGDWNFSTTPSFGQEVFDNATAQDMFDAYGASVMPSNEEPPRAKAGRRRPPPQALAAPLNPLLKVFDPNTKSNYHDNSKVHYGQMMSPPTSDLPLRDDSARTAIKDTMIDLDGHDSDPGLSSFREDTIKPAGRRMDDEDEFSTMHDFSRPALSDPADANPNRRTQDWTFPSASAIAPPASADPEVSRFPSSYSVSRPAITPGSGARPTLIHHPTEPLGASFSGPGILGSAQPALERRSMAESLIDLDMSMPDSYPEVTRPSTANSDVSTSSEQMTSGNPFEFERHASYQAPVDQAEPSIYIDDTTLPAAINLQTQSRDIADVSDFSVSDIEHDPRDDPDYTSMPPPPRPNNISNSFLGSHHEQPYTVSHFPELPEPPSAAALTGTASPTEMAAEFQRILDSLIKQLGAFADVYVTDEFSPKPKMQQLEGNGL
ncbi:Serine/threonine-protein kinase [Lachnellula subtilissima]|uniref:Serine/threonine-protein kinase n=1 Tax=Lachnellula subtilissima TaxID=602034 RepID=A0A8H8RIS6_9HELO|nr:Serine/threonine-protein kinase [Lachnellula subtilissima]